MCSAFFFLPVLLYFSSRVAEDRRQAAQGGAFSELLGLRQAWDRGLEGRGERLQGVLRRSRVYDGGVVLQVLQV